MSISLRQLRENGGATVRTVVEKRLKGTSRGLGYWAAWDAAPKVGLHREAGKKQPNQ